MRGSELCIYLSAGWLAFTMAVAEERKESVAAHTVASIKGGTVSVPDPNAKATVLIFSSTTCPISNGYAPEITRLCKEFTARGAAFRIVYAERDLTLADAVRHAEEFALPSPAILDRDLRLAARVGATMTPEAAVLSREGAVLYLGRIDDIYADFGKKRAQPEHRDLRDALESVLAGRVVARAHSPSIGCHIDFGPRPRDRK